MYSPVFLLSDILYFLVLLAVLGFFIHARHSRMLTQIKATILTKQGMFVFLILCAYFFVATMDSIHFRCNKTTKEFNQGNIVSVLDIYFARDSALHEVTYSSPLAVRQFTAQSPTATGWYYPSLQIVGNNIASSPSLYHEDIAKRLLKALISTSVFALACWLFMSWYLSFTQRRERFPLGTFMLAISLIGFFVALIVFFKNHYHLLGTDKVGNDILYISLKSIHTAFILGAVTMLVMLPLAIIFGLNAGYWGGRTDDIIQYIYTTLSSIPSVLLIIASVMALQIFIERHDSFLNNMVMRADVKLLLLCVILGITSWTNLCRVLRAETLKIRELDYVQAAKVLGSSHTKILFKHILPNVLHIIIITVILDFSLLVLAEAVLTYVGVGVDPTTYSWGNMIDAARMELARTPLIWWPIASAFGFMFIFILAINLFVDKLTIYLDWRD
jgi:peptide/nickel transport system permease protein